MEVALARLVGAGILAFAGPDAARSGSIAPAAPDPDRPLAVITSLSREGCPWLRPLIQEAVAAMLADWRAAALPQRLAEAAIDMLPGVICQSAFSQNRAAELLALARLAARNGHGVEDLASRAATELLSAAADAGRLRALRLNRELCSVLVEPLFRVVLQHADGIADWSGGDARATAAVLIPVTAPAASTNIKPRDLPRQMTPPLAARIRATLQARGKSEHFLHEHACDIEIRAELMFQAFVAACANDATVAVHQALYEAAAHIAKGAIESGQHTLEEAEATLQQGGATVDAVASVRGLRAALAAVLRDWRLAARHHAQAARLFPDNHRRERWQQAMLQADALVLQADEFGDTNALFEAAQVHAEAGSLITEREAPLDWATAHVELGRLLLRLGDHEGRPERYLAAALHFKPAVDVFSAEHAEEDWAAAQLGLGHALKGQGEFQGDVVTLADAVFCFRAALGVMTRDRCPREWIEAQVALGETLDRIGEETGDQARFAEALATLRQASAYCQSTRETHMAAELLAAQGRACLGLASSSLDERALDDAASMLTAALAATGAALAPAKAAACQRSLGTALWALGETRSDADALRRAAGAKFSALGYYETVNDEIASGELREELDGLREVMERLGFDDADGIARDPGQATAAS